MSHSANWWNRTNSSSSCGCNSPYISGVRVQTGEVASKWLRVSQTPVRYVRFVYIRVYPVHVVPANSLAFPWRQMWLHMISVSVLKLIFNNGSASAVPRESKPSTKKGISCPSQDPSSHWGVHIVNSQWPFCKYDVSSENHEIVMWLQDNSITLQDNYTECSDKSMV